MPLGVIINVCAVVLGGWIGSLVGEKLSDPLKNEMTVIFGICAMGMGVRTPATTSSPCAFFRNSPISFFSPVAGSRVNATPVPDSLFRLPNTMGITFTAVPQE